MGALKKLFVAAIAAGAITVPLGGVASADTSNTDAPGVGGIPEQLGGPPGHEIVGVRAGIPGGFVKTYTPGDGNGNGPPGSVCRVQRC
jgi:hypothetical protein